MMRASTRHGDALIPPVARAIVTTLLALFVLPGILGGLTSCSIKKMAVKSVANSLTSGPDVFGSDEDPQLIRDAVPFGLKTMESRMSWGSSDRKSTRLNSSHSRASRMPSSA